MAIADLAAKLELASVGYLAPFMLAANLSSVLVTNGKSSSTKDTVPLVVCGAIDGPEDPPDSGNFDLELVIEVYSSAAVDTGGVDPAPGDNTLIGVVFGAFLENNLPAALSSQIADFTCFAIHERMQTSTQSGDVWKNELRMRAYCCPSTLSP